MKNNLRIAVLFIIINFLFFIYIFIPLAFNARTYHFFLLLPADDPNDLRLHLLRCFRLSVRLLFMFSLLVRLPPPISPGLGTMTSPGFVA